MVGHQCYHCKQWVEEGEAHDCWTTTEAALTRHLSEDLQDAWERLRETAVGFGDQRIYASHKSIMFSRKSCYFFVRPKRDFLEVCVFLGRTLKAPQVRRADRASKSKVYHILHIRHRDEVETPITDWLQEAYALSETLSSRAGTTRAEPSAASKPKLKPKPKRKPKSQSQSDGRPKGKAGQKATKTTTKTKKKASTTMAAKTATKVKKARKATVAQKTIAARQSKKR